MTDIAKCTAELTEDGLMCPFKDKCFRYTSVPVEHQHYFLNTPFNLDLKLCQAFYPNYRD